MVLPEGDTPHPGKMLDMAMLVWPGGEERTLTEYDHLLSKRGSRLTRVVPTDSAVNVVEAVPAKANFLRAGVKFVGKMATAFGLALMRRRALGMRPSSSQFDRAKRAMATAEIQEPIPQPPRGPLAPLAPLAHK
jgi:hypothetical protein